MTDSQTQPIAASPIISADDTDRQSAEGQYLQRSGGLKDDKYEQD